MARYLRITHAARGVPHAKWVCSVSSGHGGALVDSRVGPALAESVSDAVFLVCTEMFSANNKQQTQSLWMWRMEYLHHEQRPLYFGEWF